jgi:hypothetical protein
MLDQAKLDLSSGAQRSKRDVWRAAGDLLGGVLPLLVWLALWAWMAAAVVRPLSSVFPAPDAARAGSAVSITAPPAGSGT